MKEFEWSWYMEHQDLREIIMNVGVELVGSTLVGRSHKLSDRLMNAINSGATIAKDS